jgi:hypothetical protein
MEIRANARKNQEYSGIFIRKYVKFSYFITILHKNLGELSIAPSRKPSARAYAYAGWIQPDGSSGGGGVFLIGPYT